MSQSVGQQRDSRWFALVVLCAGMLMIILDGTIVNVALPVIQADLDFSQSGLAWVINAYLIPFGGLLLLAGRTGDLIGRKRMFLGGITVFTVASLLCGFANSQELLIAARFVQGVGGAMAAAVILGMIVTMFPEKGEQARAIAVFSFVAAAGGSIGLLAGGVLTEAISWHWIFFVNVPIGIVALALAVRKVPGEQGIGLKEGADVLGALYLEKVLRYDPLQIGLAFLPVAVGIGGLSLGASARVNARFGERNVLIGGLVLVAAGLAWFTRAPVDANYFIDVFPAVTLMGIGAGLGFPAMMTLAMSDATKDDSGVASGLVNTTQQMGGALGLAVLATMATSHTNGLLAEGSSVVEAMTSGYRVAFGIGAVLVAVAAVLAVTVLRQPKVAETEELVPVTVG